MLEKISVYDPDKGVNIEAYTDGYSYDEYGYICLVSILGHDSTVKGISSAIVSKRDVEIESNGDWLGLSAMRGTKHRIMSARLESGLLHQIVAMDLLFSKSSETNRLIYVGGGDFVSVVFNSIRENYGTPLLPEWQKWLFSL